MKRWFERWSKVPRTSTTNDVLWREVYKFRAGGYRVALWRDDFARGQFAHTVDPKDEYPILDCLIEKEKRVLEFIVPIFYPEKLTKVTVTLRTRSSHHFPESVP